VDDANNNNNKNGDNGKACKTTIVNCKRRKDDGTAILQVQPNTGRKHQFQKQLQHVGLCIANDERYGGNVDEKKDRMSAFWDKEVVLSSASSSSSKPSNTADSGDIDTRTSSTRRRAPLPLEELLSASFTEGCSFCTLGKNLFESAKTDGEKILGPSVSTGIWLHSWRYEFPTLDLSFETPIPEWATDVDD
jgi:hypothetical protein